MTTRFTFASNPKIVTDNGSRLSPENTPSISATRIFFIELMECMFLAVNPYNNHECKGICRQTLQVLIYKQGRVAKDLVSR